MTEQFKESLKILEEIDNQLAEITETALEVYRNYCNDNSKSNWVTLSSVYGFLLIRACAFYDELTEQFEKLAPASNDKELKKGISFYKGLFTNYDTKKLRNYLAHNRKRVSRDYVYINDEDIRNLRVMKSHPEHNGFSVGASLIIKSLHRLYPVAFENV